MKNCACCGKQFEPEIIKVKKPNPRFMDEMGGLFAFVQSTGLQIASEYCKDKKCQEMRQYECDQFDMMRKGEF